MQRELYKYELKILASYPEVLYSDMSVGSS